LKTETRKIKKKEKEKMDYSSGANIHPSSINPLNNDKKIKKNEKGNAV